MGPRRVDPAISGVARLIKRRSANGIKLIDVRLFVEGLREGRHAAHIHEVASCQPCTAAGGQTVGIGAGQMSRVQSARIGVAKAAEAGLGIARSVMVSDAFFPFRDGIDAAAEVGVAAVI